MVKIFKNGEKGSCFRDGVDNWRCRLWEQLVPHLWICGVVDRFGGRKFFYIRSGLRLREAFGIVAGRELIFDYI
jgi:hypothetical protein